MADGMRKRRLGGSSIGMDVLGTFIYCNCHRGITLGMEFCLLHYIVLLPPPLESRGAAAGEGGVMRRDDL